MQMSKQSVRTIKSAATYTKLGIDSQVSYSLKEIDSNFGLLKSYYKKARKCEEKRKRHFYFLHEVQGRSKLWIANRYGLKRQRVGQIIQSVEEGGEK